MPEPSRPMGRPFYSQQSIVCEEAKASAFKKSSNPTKTPAFSLLSTKLLPYLVVYSSRSSQYYRPNRRYWHIYRADSQKLWQFEHNVSISPELVHALRATRNTIVCRARFHQQAARIGATRDAISSALSSGYSGQKLSSLTLQENATQDRNNEAALIAVDSFTAPRAG